MKRVGNDHVLAGAGHPRHAGMRLGVGRTQTSRQHDQWHVAEAGWDSPFARRSGAGLDNYRWRAAAAAMKMQAPSADIDQLPKGWARTR